VIATEQLVQVVAGGVSIGIELCGGRHFQSGRRYACETQFRPKKSLSSLRPETKSPYQQWSVYPASPVNSARRDTPSRSARYFRCSGGLVSLRTAQLKNCLAFSYRLSRALVLNRLLTTTARFTPNEHRHPLVCRVEPAASGNMKANRVRRLRA
jgi:hypothetical protein